MANVREALAFALGEGDLDLSLRLARTGNPWHSGRATMEGRALVRRVIDATEHVPSPERGRALGTLAGFELVLGNYREAEALLEKAHVVSKACGDLEGAVQSLLALTGIAENRGDPDRARTLLESARSLAEEASPYQRAHVLFAAGNLESNRGPSAEADLMLAEGLEIVSTLGVPRRLWIFQLLNVAWTAILREDFPQARVALEEFLAEPFQKGPLGLAIAYVNLGLVDLFQDEPGAAAAHLRRVLHLVGDLNGNLQLTESFYGLAAVAVTDGDAERASKLWAVATHLQDGLGVPIALPQQRIVDRYLEPMRAGLDEETYAMAHAEGAVMTLDQAVAYALDESSSRRYGARGGGR